jgi:hypothetical protein
LKIKTIPVILVFVVFLGNYYIGLKNRFFFADDWGWILNSETYSWQQIFKLLPAAIYNDRPIGALFINLEYEFFQLDYASYRTVHILIHCLNTYLLYLILNRLTTQTASLAGSFYFGMYYPANLAAFWIAAVFDLLSLTFILIAIFVLVSNISKLNVKHILLMTFLFYIAARTKEYAITLPILLTAIYYLLIKCTLRKIVNTFWPLYLVTIVLIIKYFNLYKDSLSTKDENDPYELSIGGILKNIAYYFEHTSGLYRMEAIQRNIIMATSVFVLIHVIRKNRSMLNVFLMGLIGFILTLGPVLLLSDQRSNLYTYAPHAFFAFCLSLFFSFKKELSRAVAVASLLVFSLFLSIPAKEVLNFNFQKSQYSLEVWENSQSVIQDLKPNSEIFILGLEPYFNPFSYGPGASIRILNQDSTIVTYIDQSENEILRKFCSSVNIKNLLVFDGVKLLADTGPDC